MHKFAYAVFAFAQFLHNPEAGRVGQSFQYVYCRMFFFFHNNIIQTFGKNAKCFCGNRQINVGMMNFKCLAFYNKNILNIFSAGVFTAMADKIRLNFVYFFLIFFCGRSFASSAPVKPGYVSGKVYYGHKYLIFWTKGKKWKRILL